MAIAAACKAALGNQFGGSSPSSPTTSRDGLEMVPAQSHKLNYGGSNPSPATNLYWVMPGSG